MTTTEGPEYFFAVLGQTGVEHCPEGSMDSTWLDLRPTLGFVAFDGPAADDTGRLDELYDLPVLAQGLAGPAPARRPLEVSPQLCPQMQMRSDWVSTPRGIRVQRGPSPDIEHFHATKIRRLDELSVTLDGDQLDLSFQNPLPFALPAVALVLHYEGCYGKPGTTSAASERVRLEPGEVLRARLDVFAEKDHPGPRKGGPTARVHRAAAVVLELGADASGPDGERVYAELAVSLQQLGIPFECPGR